jgi:hypothetical protein
VGVRQLEEHGMSNYDNFVSDFPGRCLDLLHAFERGARFRKREVTMMLSVATPSIIIPYERLRGPESDRPGHPLRDWNRYHTAKATLDDLLQKPFIGSALWPQSSPGSWCCGGPLADVSGEPDSWQELQANKHVSKDKKAGTVLKHVRNALAHGNIFTRGRPEIERLVLLSQVGEVFKFNFISVSPADFRAFLEHWLSFLRNLPMPTFVIPESPLWESAMSSEIAAQAR